MPVCRPSTQMKAAQAQLASTPKDQQAPIQEKINQAGSTAVTELSAALELMKPEDTNRAIVLSRLGEAYESMGKWQDAADTYQKSIAMKPDVAANYNNLGNDLAKLGKVDEARAAYQKYVDLNPTDAALAWRNFGIVLYQAEPHEGSHRAAAKGHDARSKECAGLVAARNRSGQHHGIQDRGRQDHPRDAARHD